MTPRRRPVPRPPCVICERTDCGHTLPQQARALWFRSLPHRATNDEIAQGGGGV